MLELISPVDWDEDRRQQASTLVGRKTVEEDLDKMIAEWTGDKDPQELMRTLQNAGVPAGVVNDCRDLFEDPQLTQREHFKFLDHAEIGPYPSDQSEFDLSKTPGSLDTPAPLLGEHTEYALKELVGLSEDEYRSFEDDGVLE